MDSEVNDCVRSRMAAPATAAYCDDVPEESTTGVIRSHADLSRTVPSSVRDDAARLVHGFTNWLDAYGPLSQDPHDLWASRLGGQAKELYYRRPALGTLAAAPFVALDLVLPRARALVRPPSRSPISDAHYALGFFQLARAERDKGHVEHALEFIAALEQSRSPFFDDPAWGYPFDWPSKFGMFRAGWPLITTVPYCYEAFDAAYAAVGEVAYLETMEGVARFAAEHIPVTEVGPGADAAAYSPFDRRQVVNASAYRGFLLTAAGHRFEREDWLGAARRNIALVLQSQESDGSWPYSRDGADDFIDNFHTCLVLKNLAKFWALEADEEVRAAIGTGYHFYLEHLLDESGLPIPFARRPRLTLHRRDLYDYAEGIHLGHLLRDEIPAAADVVARLVRDLGERWALPDGHFVTRELVVGRLTLPYHRWAQSQVFHALAQLVDGGR